MANMFRQEYIKLKYHVQLATLVPLLKVLLNAQNSMVMVSELETKNEMMEISIQMMDAIKEILLKVSMPVMEDLQQQKITDLNA